jgi:hypothetical protein
MNLRRTPLTNTVVLSLSKHVSRGRVTLRSALRQAQGCGIVLALVAPSPALAQQQVTSPEPEAVSLTIYRDPSRGDQPIDADWPSGYALITETRTVQIPAGESLVRFEGVSEGMYPESAIVTGLPKGVREKNRDARLLSPAGLVDAYLKRVVTLTRTDKVTGKAREQQAMITAGPDGGVILQTAEGFEALRCTGLPERMAYGGVPTGLSAKPTLSVMTNSDRAVTATLTLTYMAAGFDWQANYVTQLSKDESAATDAIGKTKVALFAWMTLANGGNQSFLNANTMAIAGTPNREANAEPPAATPTELTIRCWPQQRTHEVPFRGQQQFPWGRYQPEPDRAYFGGADSEEIVVTASRMKREMMESPMAITAVTVAELEDLGDLKLYRIPEAVTVNAKGQKQVAMIVKPDAKFDRLYRARLDEPIYIPLGQSSPLSIILKTDNKTENGLGLPLPSGQAMVFEDSNFGPLLAGEASVRDRAIGEKVELLVGTASDVQMVVTQISERKYQKGYKVTITNARSEPVNAEIEIPFDLRGKPKGIRKVDGMPTWGAVVPANNEVSFEFTLKLSRQRE